MLQRDRLPPRLTSWEGKDCRGKHFGGPGGVRVPKCLSKPVTPVTKRRTLLGCTSNRFKDWKVIANQDGWVGNECVGSWLCLRGTAQTSTACQPLAHDSRNPKRLLMGVEVARRLGRVRVWFLVTSTSFLIGYWRRWTDLALFLVNWDGLKQRSGLVLSMDDILKDVGPAAVQNATFIHDKLQVESYQFRFDCRY